MGEHERPGADEQRASPAFDERCKRGLDIGIAARVDDDELLPDRLRRALHLSALRLGVGGVRIDKHRNRSRGGHDLAQQLKSFRSQYAGEKDYAGDVAARPAEAGDEAVPDRVAATNTIGTVVVAALAASAALWLPTITATGRR